MQYREDATVNNRLILAVDEVLNGGVRPSFVVCKQSYTRSNLTGTKMKLQGAIRVTELNLGEEFPIFSRARIRPSDDLGSMVITVAKNVDGSKRIVLTLCVVEGRD